MTATIIIVCTDYSSYLAYIPESLRSCLQTNDKGITKKDKVCVEYALLRQTKLPDLWKSFLISIGCAEMHKEPLLMEVVNESIFEGIIKENFVLFGKYLACMPCIIKCRGVIMTIIQMRVPVPECC